MSIYSRPSRKCSTASTPFLFSERFVQTFPSDFNFHVADYRPITVGRGLRLTNLIAEVVKKSCSESNGDVAEIIDVICHTCSYKEEEF